jgi:1,4-alpha-glucan branching enzyme
MTDELRAFPARRAPRIHFAFSAQHRLREDVLIRVFRPDAREVSIELDNNGAAIPAEKIQGEGLFQATLEKCARDVPYTLKIKRWDGSEQITRDPYSYGVIMGEVDLHLFGEGQHWRLYEKFGAHVRKVGEDLGVYFAVWAPNAQRVSVVGDFNGWDGRVHPMRKLIGSGVWELFIPGIGENAHYKFEIRTGPRRDFFKKRSVRLFQPARQGNGLAGLRSDSISLVGRRVDGGTAVEEFAAQPAQHL